MCFALFRFVYIFPWSFTVYFVTYQSSVLVPPEVQRVMCHLQIYTGPLVLYGRNMTP